MDTSIMPSQDLPHGADGADTRRLVQHHPPRHAASMHETHTFATPLPSTASRSLRSSHGTANGASGPSYSSPAKKDKKHVVFQLIDPQDPRIQARLPMRVMISPHDTAESIITTIKNFYGLYEYGVSFENKDGIGMIAAYDNFEHDMTVHVRTVALPPAPLAEYARDSASPKKPSLGAPIDLRQSFGHSPSRSAARSAGVRSVSPQSDAGRRSMSAALGGKPRPQRTKSKDNSAYGEADGYSSGDNGGGSVASSRRSKAEPVNAEISVDNIVEGGRRKRAFESSELPLFVPPQVPMTASISSVSPQRRVGPLHTASPYAHPNQQTFSYQQPLPSPQSFGSASHHLQSGAAMNGHSGIAPQPSRQLRGRPGPIFYPPRHPGSGILPTPDPTVGSAISDEDVALQLMRLGDPMAFSNGRTSNSTADDALSGKAELASSDDDDDEEEEQELKQSTSSSAPRLSHGETGPVRKKQRLMNELPSDATSGEELEDHRDGTFYTSDEGLRDQNGRKKSKSSKPRINNGLPSKGPRPRADPTIKPKAKAPAGSTSSSSKGLASPSSVPAPSRKGSLTSSTLNFLHPLGADEEDLSTKPRCQRCRKSKKGCDRQRPCGRCKDAGIGIEGCVSEDEGNGRKGRYGRHMGVPIKKNDENGAGMGSLHDVPLSAASMSSASSFATSAPVGGPPHAGLMAASAMHMSPPSASHHHLHHQHHPSPAPFPGYPPQNVDASNAVFLAPALPDKNKKRKR